MTSSVLCYLSCRLNIVLSPGDKISVEVSRIECVISAGLVVAVDGGSVNGRKVLPVVK